MATMASDIVTGLEASRLYDLTGVVAIVTGGGTGIGLMISSTLVANGAKVYIIGPEQSDLDHIANIYNDVAVSQGKQGKMIGLEGDVRLKSEADRLAQEIGKREPYVTVLFNNAGVGGPGHEQPKENTAASFTKAFTIYNVEDFDRNFHTNAVGPYFLSVAFLNLLTASKGHTRYPPQIINTCSINSFSKEPRTGANSIPYLMSKSAVAHLTMLLAHEFRELGVRCNGIAPGLFPTEMTAPGTADALGRSGTGMRHDVWGFEVPVKRVGSGEDMGRVALTLVTNNFINGEIVLIDGGTLACHASMR